MPQFTAVSVPTEYTENSADQPHNKGNYGKSQGAPQVGDLSFVTQNFKFAFFQTLVYILQK